MTKDYQNHGRFLTHRTVAPAGSALPIRSRNRIAGILRSMPVKDLTAVVIDDLFHPRPRSSAMGLDDHITAAYSWICAAHDAVQGGGVASAYSLLRGWRAPYPETTGYIFPTLLAIFRDFANPDARARAIRMADWEISVQLKDGAVRAGTLETHEAPAVFNTGQVIFGWLAAFEETGDPRYADAACWAGDWLLTVQDQDGAWRRYLSVINAAPVCTYNARTAWALVSLGLALNDERYIQGGRANLDWCLRQQRPNGWFAYTGFHPGQVPILHTIGYVIEGLFEAGQLLGESRYSDAANVAACALLSRWRADGVLRGDYDEEWRPRTSSRCLTGEAQIALTWLRRYEVMGDKTYGEAGQAVNRQVMALQKVKSSSRGLAGGIKGSHPIWGSYQALNYPNWAVKFFLDSLLLERRVLR